MPAQQPTLDGTIPAVADDYLSWVDQVRPAFVEAARATSAKVGASEATRSTASVM